MQQSTDPDRTPLLDAPNGKACEVRFALVEEALAEGYSLQIAAMKAGVDRKTLRRWFQRGMDGSQPEFTEFLQRCEAARASFEMTRVDIIKKAGDKGEWTAAAWWLERMEPDTYGKKQVMRHEKVEMPSEWTMEIEGAVDSAGLPNQTLRELPPAKEPIEVEAAVSNG